MFLNESQKSIIQQINDGKITSHWSGLVPHLGVAVVNHDSTMSDVGVVKRVLEPITADGLMEYFHHPGSVIVYDLALEVFALTRFLLRRELIVVTKSNQHRLRLTDERRNPHDPLFAASQDFAKVIFLYNSDSEVLVKGSICEEYFVPLPDLQKFIDNGFRTQDEAQHDELIKQANDARNDAKISQRWTYVVAIASILLSVLTLAVQSCGVTDMHLTNESIRVAPANVPTYPPFNHKLEPAPQRK